MEKIMTVSELATKYNKTVDKLRGNILKEIKSKDYVAFADKHAQMLKIVNATHINKDGGLISVRPMKFVLFTMAIIEMYTNIKTALSTDNNDSSEDSQVLIEYDELNKSGLIERLLNPSEDESEIIPVKEIAECNSILNMLEDDFMANNHNLEASIERIVARFVDYFTDDIAAAKSQLAQLAKK